MTVRGVDTIDHTLTGAILAEHDYAFVCRYYAGGKSTIGKEIIRSEVVEKTAAGVRIVSNWELMEDPPNTLAEGRAHARAFLEQHAEIGGPDWAPCYYSVDTAARAGAYDNYAHGWADVLTPERLGVYGDGALYRALKKAGLVRLAWQSMSKSFPGNTDGNGAWDHSGADIIQTGRGTVAGHSVDFNTAPSAHYGGWLLGEDDPTMALGVDVWNTDQIPNPRQRPDSPLHVPKPAKPNPTTQADFALGDMWQLIYNLRDAVAALTATNAGQVKQMAALIAMVDALAAKGTSIDTAAVLLAIGKQGSIESAAVAGLQRQLADLQSDYDATKAALAAALAAHTAA